LVLIQGLNNLENRAGLYRSEDGSYAAPSEFLNLLRRYTDLKTTTLRLEAEACDSYRDSTPGNSGNAYRRSGDLDVRSSAPGSWVVTDTAAAERIDFGNIDFSAGNYQLSARYSTSNVGPGHGVAKRLELLIDRQKQVPVIVKDTASSASFDSALVAQSTFAHGPHQLELRFLDGFVDLDWLFVKKIDPVLSLKIAAGTFESAQGGGGGNVKSTAPGAAIYEQFTFDDLNGGTLDDGDSVQIQVWNGLYLSASGTSVTADVRAPMDTETFKVHLVTGSSIAQGGSTVAISTSSGKYLTDGAGSVLDASGTSVQAAQTFIVGTY
jgi:hypothetical protein